MGRGNTSGDVVAYTAPGEWLNFTIPGTVITGVTQPITWLLERRQRRKPQTTEAWPDSAT